MPLWRIDTSRTQFEQFEITAATEEAARAAVETATAQLSSYGARTIESVLELPAPQTPIHVISNEYREIRGRVPVDPAIFQQPRTMVLACDGQSMLGNYSELSGWEPSAADEIYELDVWSGNIYRVDSNVILGSDGWTGRSSVLPYLAWNQLALGKASRVLLACIFVGGTTAFQWSPYEGNKLFTRRNVILEKLAAHGLTPTHWLSVQGQGDVEPSNPGAAASAQNYCGLRMWGFQALRMAGYSGPIIAGLGCHWAGVSTLQPERTAFIRAGQAMLASQGILLGYDDDLLAHPQYRASDQTHWGNVGRWHMTQGWSPIISAV